MSDEWHPADGSGDLLVLGRRPAYMTLAASPESANEAAGPAAAVLALISGAGDDNHSPDRTV